MSEGTDLMNLDNYKSDSENYKKLLNKIIKLIPSETLKQELKRRKLIKFDWESNKFLEVKNEK